MSRDEASCSLRGIISTQGLDKIVWETRHVMIERRDGVGFGMAVSGGVGNSHFISGETSIAVSNVLEKGPADGKLR